MHSLEAQSRLRDIYNHVWTELGTFQDVLEALYTTNTNSVQEWSISNRGKNTQSKHQLC